jgi:Tfp pilus assembly protein PilX
MKNINPTVPGQNRSIRQSSRGVALVFTLLILALMMVLSLGMVIALSSQTFISGYYRNSRGAFYAADSGVNYARVAMVDEVNSLVPATIALGTQPLSTANATTVQTYINSTYGSWTSLTSGQAASSWPEQFELSSGNPATFTFSNCHLSYSTVGTPPAGGPYTCTSLPPTANLCSTAAGVLTNCYTISNFQYTYAYSIDSIGQVSNNEQAEVVDSGNISITVNISQPSSVTKNQSFAAWGMFIDQSPICSGSTLVNGTLTGPVFTNGSWNFNTGSYIFTDSVGQQGTQAGANFSDGTCNQASALPNSHSGATVNPTFNNQFQMNQAHITPPPNSFSQMWAAVDGKGTGEADASPTGTDMNNAGMKNAAGTLWPISTSAQPTSGVYMPSVAVGSTLPTGATCAGLHPCISGGGIYVKGSATVTMQASGTTAQIFTIVNNSQTTTVTVNLPTGPTTFQTGGNLQTLTGVPSNFNVNPATEATMLYVDGAITSLAGAGTTSIQNNSAVTVTANGDMTITGNITYATEPVTMTQNQIPGTPADTLITLPASASTQVLGLFTASGNVNLAVPSNNQNLEIDASIAAIGGAGTGGIVNNGNSINTLNIVGGRIQSTIQNIGATTRNVFFDRRFAQGNFAPPWFPSTTITSTPTGVENSSVATPSVQRVEWRCKSCQ